MHNIDSYNHTRGESIYLDDIPELNGTLYACVYGSPLAHGHIKSLFLDAAMALEGVERIITHRDIPGKNQIGGIIPDEPLLAEDEVHFQGMPVAIVIATTADVARAAVKLIRADIEPMRVVTDPREARALNLLIQPPRTFKMGNSSEAFASCKYVVEGVASNNGQEHLYIETQGAYALPLENGAIRIYSSTQGPTAVQKHAAAVLGIPMHKVEVDVTRLGGGFGGKEDQATVWGVMCALASQQLKRPVKYSLHRMEDMRMTGKRHPYSSDYKIGLSEDLKIIAYEVTFHQDAGASADLSPAVLERTLFHCTNTYFIPNVTATAYSCKTNLPPNTAFRGFGGPQGMFVVESAIAKAAAFIGVDASAIQQRNLLKTGDEFPYGQKAVSEAGDCWQKACETFEIEDYRQRINEFNTTHPYFKKGLSLMPICFGISFTKTLMNQARALVHVYTDGSVNISTGAVEMGQGVNTKMLQVAAAVFSLPAARISVNSTNTFRIANTSPSAASATADLNGKAVLVACQAIRDRLQKVAGEILQVPAETIYFDNGYVGAKNNKASITWPDLIAAAYVKRISLSEHGHYSTPDIHFDPSKEKGHPFAYHVYGTAITEVTVDCLRGTYEIDAVKVVHDFGQSMNAVVDRGQIEGGIVQGIGWMTMEEIVYDQDGKLRSNALSTYKVPDIYSAPKELQVINHESSKENLAIFNSKAVGEPPLMYGIGAYFAIHRAIKAFNPRSDVGFDAPFTPEKVLMALYPENIDGANKNL